MVQLLNYSALSLPGLTIAVKDFLQYQEQQGKQSLEQLAADDAAVFIELLMTQTGKRTGRQFSNGHINKHRVYFKLSHLKPLP